jgi:hypothetical protein
VVPHVRTVRGVPGNRYPYRDFRFYVIASRRHLSALMTLLTVENFGGGSKPLIRHFPKSDRFENNIG